MKKLFFSPVGLQRGMKKHESPFSACARTRKASHIGAEMNHLCPLIRYARDLPSLCARVTLARTSETPCFSVIPIPRRTPAFPCGGMNRGSYFEERILGPHSCKRSG